LADELERVLRDEPILAQPVGPAEKLWRWSRRNTKVASLAGSLILVFALGFIGVFWEWRRAEHNALEEQRQRLRTETMIEQTEIQRAEDFFAADNSAAGLAYLARVLRQHPTNQVAAERLLSALTHRSFALPLTEPLKHDDRVRSARFSSDGQRVVTASDDKTARVWDSRTGEPIAQPLKHDGPVRSAEFSEDGERILSVSSDTALVWDARTGQLLTQPMKHDAIVSFAEMPTLSTANHRSCRHGVLSENRYGSHRPSMACSVAHTDVNNRRRTDLSIAVQRCLEHQRLAGRIAGRFGQRAKGRCYSGHWQRVSAVLSGDTCALRRETPARRATLNHLVWGAKTGRKRVSNRQALKLLTEENFQ